MVMHQDIPMSEGSIDEIAQVMALVATFEQVLCKIYDDPRDVMAMGMTAGAMLAGSQYGYAVAAGIESGSRSRVKRIIKMVEKNFLSGKDVALRKAARVAKEQGLSV